MKLIGCDRCSASLPADKPHTELVVYDLESDEGDHRADFDLCFTCRSDLATFLTGTLGVPERVGPQTIPGRETGPQPTPAPQPDAQDLDEPSTAPRAQDAMRHTCEICGREGTRRFVETETGWRCAPSATKCPGNKQPDSAPEPVVAPVAGVHDERPLALAAGITAKCQDCTRTWTLTGRVLRSAVEMHEQKHSHFVDVADGATA